MHVSSVSSAFRHMLQVLHLNVLKIEVLHLSPRFYVASHRCLFLLRRRLGIHFSFSMLVTLGPTQALCGRVKHHMKRLQTMASGCSVRSDVQAPVVPKYQSKLSH
jgi:hypothetical protein